MFPRIMDIIMRLILNKKDRHVKKGYNTHFLYAFRTFTISIEKRPHRGQIRLIRKLKVL